MPQAVVATSSLAGIRSKSGKQLDKLVGRLWQGLEIGWLITWHLVVQPAIFFSIALVVAGILYMLGFAVLHGRVTEDTPLALNHLVFYPLVGVTMYFMGVVRGWFYADCD